MKNQSFRTKISDSQEIICDTPKELFDKVLKLLSDNRSRSNHLEDPLTDNNTLGLPKKFSECFQAYGIKSVKVKDVLMCNIILIMYTQNADLLKGTLDNFEKIDFRSKNVEEEFIKNCHRVVLNYLQKELANTSSIKVCKAVDKEVWELLRIRPKGDISKYDYLNEVNTIEFGEDARFYIPNCIVKERLLSTAYQGLFITLGIAVIIGFNMLNTRICDFNTRSI